jgi:hypothetical protein
LEEKKRYTVRLTSASEWYEKVVVVSERHHDLIGKSFFIGRPLIIEG